MVPGSHLGGRTASCPVCGGTHISGFLSRLAVPVHQNLILPSVEQAQSASRGDLDMWVCGSCGFVFNQAFDPEKLKYGEDYDNTQSWSPYFDHYLDDLVADLVENKHVRNSVVVEVGCGQAHFLRKLIAYGGANNRGYGFDPSYKGPDTDLDGRLTFRRAFYDESCLDISADVVLCRHVIEHVQDPITLLRSVRRALDQSPNARVFFETPCVEWILRNKVVWDFFYEHCSLFSATALRLVFEISGFDVLGISHIFGGQYLWVEARAAQPHRSAAPEQPETAALASAYGESEIALRQRLSGSLRELRAKGPVAIWGAGAKGVTLCNLVDPDRQLIDCVVDVNPNKQGAFIPGTGHSIVAPAELGSRGISSAILTNPNYRQENLRILSDQKIGTTLVEWSY
jgi:SAM-dependent methyltransferase